MVKSASPSLSSPSNSRLEIPLSSPSLLSEEEAEESFLHEQEKISLFGNLNLHSSIFHLTSLSPVGRTMAEAFDTSSGLTSIS